MSQKNSESSRRTSSSHIQKRKLTVEEVNALHKEFTTDDHLIPLKELCDKLKTNIKIGLTDEEAMKRIKVGQNVLSPPKITPEYIKFLKCMFSGFAAVLWVCAGLCFIIYGIGILIKHDDDEGIQWFGIIIIIICLVSGLFAFIQESKNSKVMESFTQMVPTFALVLRNGKKKMVLTEELVLGDIVEIKLGDKIPADIRIISCLGLRVENSSLTGESEPVARTDYPTDPNPLETKNLAFFSSYAVGGEGTGIIIATGDDTMIGRLAGLTTQVEKMETPIAKEIKHFVKIITFVAILFGIVFFGLSLIVEPNIIKGFTYLLGIIIANVPEILLVTVTTSLTLTAKKMANKNCLVRNLEAVETLGSTSTICSDKTGTLTQNKMTVSNLWFGYTRHNFPPGLWNLGAERDLLIEKPAFNIIIKAATLCLRAEFRNDNELFKKIDDKDVIGDASETGILKFCERIHNTKQFRNLYPKVIEIPFSSITKYQMSIHKNNDDGYYLYMKGAPEIIIDFCTKILTMDGNSKDLLPSDINKIKNACSELGFLGERVLAYCDFHLVKERYGPNYKFNTSLSGQQNYNFPRNGYRFLGLISLIDPPRPAVPEAVNTCRAAGIKVIMVTGDHPITAISIAKAVGIIKKGHETRYERAVRLEKSISQVLPETSTSPSTSTSDNNQAIIITGSELRNMDNNEIDDIIRNYEEIVFARTSPQQKLIIVESCQRLGEIVAVTGDGVNDSPALRKADIGIAMGITGSDVAKNAADMVLMDDNFSSIVTGIEEGRLIFDNLKKSIAYTLTSSVPEMVPMLSSIILSIPLPFVIELVLCIDIGTDLLPAIALAYEKSEADIMKRGPRNPLKDKLVNKRLISIAYGQIGMTQSLAGFMNYFMILAYYGFLPGDLIGLRHDWENKSINNLNDSYGQEWTYENRMNLLNRARTGYYVSIVTTQMIDLIMCKTRRNSIFQQGMNNWMLNLAFLFEICLTASFLYIPGIGKVLKTMPLEYYWFFPCLPLGLFLWFYDEIRRYCIRNYPGGFMDKETYY